MSNTWSCVLYDCMNTCHIIIGKSLTFECDKRQDCRISRFSHFTDRLKQFKNGNLSSDTH